MNPNCYSTHKAMHHPMTKCNFFDDWVSCDTVGCCNPTGYDKDDFVQVCSGGLMLIGQSLTDNNCDEPVIGSTSVPPTWKLSSLSEWLTRRGTIGVTPPKITGDKTANLNDMVTLTGVAGTTNDKMCEPTSLEWILPNGNTICGLSAEVTKDTSGLYVVIGVTVDACGNRSSPSIHIIDFKNPLLVTPPTIIGSKTVVVGSPETITAIPGQVNDHDQMPIEVFWTLPDASTSTDQTQVVTGVTAGNTLIYSAVSRTVDGIESTPSIFQITVEPAKDDNYLI